ncbi:MAG: N-acetylmuramoyl-L-alanine amidase [Thermodesulfobacteriota bacterium]
MAEKKFEVFQKAATLLLVITAMAAFSGVSESLADTAEQQFYSADAGCQKFLKDDEKTKYRENWLFHIRKFQKAFRTNPAGSLAPASLYWIGKLYHDLYSRSFLTSDREEAIDAYERLIRRHPHSTYRKKAEAELAGLAPTAERVETKTPLVSKEDYQNPPETKNSAKLVVKSSRARSGSGAAGPVPHKKRGSVFIESKENYRGSVAEKESEEIARLILKRQKVRERLNNPPAVPVSSSPQPEGPSRTRPNAPSSSGRTVIQGLRVWSNPNYTRIVVDADHPTSFRHHLLNPDTAHHKPQRLYIDFDNSRLGRKLEKVIPINDNLLTATRAGQRNPNVVRVVVDIKSFQSYKVFALQNPFRTIIDIWGTETLYAESSKPPPVSEPVMPVVNRPSTLPITPQDLAKQLALGVRRIVIDPGHGGHDPGAPGCMKGVNEKDIVLQIALRLARKIRRELGCEVILTRSDDRFLSLEERTAIANTKNADLFVSIHANAHTDRRAYGLETYFLNLATDEDAVRVAARENATSRKNISDLQTILSDLMKNSKINESSRLAGYVQKSMTSHLKGHYSNIKDKGVKQAPFYVLLGAQMPSILVEAAFISNPRECKRLMDGNYQEHLSSAIIRGIRAYITETSPTAFLRQSPRGRG